MPLKTSRKSLFLEIVQRLEMDITASSDRETLSIVALAKRYHIGCRTMSKAAHALKVKGVIRIIPGKGIEAIEAGSRDASQPPDTSPDSSGSRLYRKMREPIIEGTSRTGHALAKIRTLARSEHVAEGTVCEALRMLAKENLIHKVGRRWICGPRPAESSVHDVFLSQTSSIPVALVLWPDFWSWNNMCHYPKNFNFYFYQTFKNEIEMHGISIQPGFTHSTDTRFSFPKGIEQIRNFVSSLGNRYMGTLKCTYSESEGEMWLEELARFKKPVVCLHKPYDYRKANAAEQYVYCDLNERDAVALALDALASQGHRVIGTLRPGLEDEEKMQEMKWIEIRAGIMETLAARRNPPLKIIAADQKEEFWYDSKWRGEEKDFSSLLHSLVNLHDNPAEKGSGEAVGVSRIDAIRQCSPSLHDLVTYPDLTAIIAPNDLFARLYSIWLSEAGIAVPGDISLIGFDNDIESHYHKITTVDFCFGNLGYKAAHILIGDIPIRIGRDRAVRAGPRIINRGSIAPPKNAP